MAIDWFARWGLDVGSLGLCSSGWSLVVEWQNPSCSTELYASFQFLNRI